MHMGKLCPLYECLFQFLILLYYYKIIYYNFIIIITNNMYETKQYVLLCIQPLLNSEQTIIYCWLNKPLSIICMKLFELFRLQKKKKYNNVI